MAPDLNFFPEFSKVMKMRYLRHINNDVYYKLCKHYVIGLNTQTKKIFVINYDELRISDMLMSSKKQFLTKLKQVL